MTKKNKPFLCNKKSGKFISSRCLGNRGADPGEGKSPEPKEEFARFAWSFEQAIKKAVGKK